MVIIINYGVGNLGSIKNMISRLGFECKISDNIADIEKATKLILPGVGNFSYGMEKLIKSGLIETLNKVVFVDKTPILGICLGAQLMCKHSEEGDVSGLGWFDATVKKFNFLSNDKEYKIPHMGWAHIKLIKSSPLFNEILDTARFYFVHSYHFVVSDSSICLAKTKYNYEFISALEYKNIFAVQFHPEKSHKYGMQLMKNFLSI